MLVLSRAVGESIRVGDNVQITIVANRNGEVRFGIDAPKDIAVHREEVYNRINNLNQPKNVTS